MPPRKPKAAARVPEKATLSEKVLDHIKAMASGSPHGEAVTWALTQRTLEALALANEMFAKARKADEFNEDAQDSIALAALAALSAKAAHSHLHSRLAFFLGAANVDTTALNTWEKRSEVGQDMAGLSQPEDDPALAEPETLTSAELAALEQDNRDMGAIQAAYAADRDLANQMLGEARMAAAIGKFAQAISFTKLAQVKEHKLYKSLPNGLATWEGFCTALGLSRSKVDEDLLNLRTFGQEAMQALTQAGAGIRQLRALRALPEGERETVAAELAEAAKAQTKEEVIEILDEALDRHAARQEALEKQVADQAADLEARDKLLEDKGKRLDKREMELAKLKSLPAKEQYRLQLEREKAAVETLQTVSMEALVGMEKLLAHCEEVLAADVSMQTRTYCEDTVRMLVQSLGELIAKHGIETDLEAVVAPAWAKDVAKDEIKAGAK